MDSLFYNTHIGHLEQQNECLQHNTVDDLSPSLVDFGCSVEGEVEQCDMSLGPSSSKSTGTMAGLSDIVSNIDDFGSSLPSHYGSGSLDFDSADADDEPLRLLGHSTSVSEDLASGNSFIDIAGVEHSSPSKTFSFFEDHVTNEAEYIVETSSPSSKAEVLLSWKYHSGSARQPSLQDSYRIQIEGMHIGKKTKHVVKKRRPNGTDGGKATEADGERVVVRSEDDILWEQEMGKSDTDSYNSNVLLQLTQNWEKRWDTDEEEDDDDGEENNAYEEMSESMDSSVDSDESMASLSSGLDSVTLDALLEVGSNLGHHDNLDMAEVSFTDDQGPVMRTLVLSSAPTSLIQSSSSSSSSSSASAFTGSLLPTIPFLIASRAPYPLAPSLSHVRPQKSEPPLLKVLPESQLQWSQALSLSRSLSPSELNMTLSPLTLGARDSPSTSFLPPQGLGISDTVYHSSTFLAGARRYVYNPNDKKINRGKYKCGRCGQPKQNHNCEYVVLPDVCSTGTQMQHWNHLVLHPFIAEKTLPVRTAEQRERAERERAERERENEGGQEPRWSGSTDHSRGVDDDPCLQAAVL